MNFVDNRGEREEFNEMHTFVIEDYAYISTGLLFFLSKIMVVLFTVSVFAVAVEGIRP